MKSLRLSLNISMRITKLLLIWFIPVIFLTIHSVSFAQESKPAFVTIVNPVRGRPMWSDLSLLKKQATSIHEKDLVATWLIQYNVLEDEDVVALLKSYQGDE